MWSQFGKPRAVARVAGGREAPGLFGTVGFYQKGKNILLIADICGLPRTDTQFFALHIHEGANCGGRDFENTRSHFNPAGNVHPMHAGDLPPLLSCEGRAFLAVLTGRFTISQILGKTVVIHDGPDDFRSQPAGNSGKKIACGVICPC